MRPRLLDLFCGAGGAAMGYHHAGFDVTGVDIAPQPRYPFTFVQADALDILRSITHYAAWREFPLRPRGLALDPPFSGEMWRPGYFDAIHASPPCRDHTRLTQIHGKTGTGWMLAATRQQLAGSGLPWVIENVTGAPMRADFKLCGCMFGLPQLRRERWFETSPQMFDMRPPCHHTGYAVTVAGHPGGRSTRDGISIALTADWQRAMGIDWMTAEQMAQAIPPAYTEYIGGLLMAVVSPANGTCAILP